MSTLKFQVKHPSGQVETLVIETERVLLGSGAHCDIRLPIDQARVEHVILEVVPQGLFVRALSFEPPPTINNVPFTQAPLPPGAIIGVGAIQVFVEAAELGQGAGGGPGGQKKGSSKLGIIALFIMLPAAAFLFLDEEAPVETKSAAKPPELWGPPVQACPHTGPQAIAFGREKIAVADAKRERTPFHVKDGVQAVPIYETAGACFRSGGDMGSAKLADEAGQYLRREINDDFRLRRVRLEHALAIQDYASAQKEVKTLLQFVEGKQGDWVTWLQNLERKLKLKVGEEKKP